MSIPGHNIGIKIPAGSPIAKCVTVVRKLEPDMPISDISSRISKNECVLSYGYTSSSGIKKIIKCYEGLTELGIKPSLYEIEDEEAEECGIQLVRNLNGMYDEISDEIDAEMEAEEEGDDE